MKTKHKVAYFTYYHILRGWISQNQGSEHLLLLLLLYVNKSAVGFLGKCGCQHSSQHLRGSRLEEEVRKIPIVKQGRIQSCLLNCTCSGVEGKESVTPGTKQASTGQKSPSLLPVSPLQRFHADDSHVQDWLIPNMLSLPV
ncbi:hypothetical protein I79_002898 [Cricetulus griseus]|uniref:Uncharacterized protein n=1 Tax=Cricetulus griseus TaxID=10029 RepID=G3GYL8_CRIGR|nr:hypothetical protein I79_002898 [Cricetulus griseus]